MTAHQSLPVTKSFKDPSKESAFRTMVDSYGLTNVVFNYEIYRHGDSELLWNRPSLVYTLDRPNVSLGPCHARQITAIETTIRRDFVGEVGWIRRGQGWSEDAVTFNSDSKKILFRPGRASSIHHSNQQRVFTATTLPGVNVSFECIIRCQRRCRVSTCGTRTVPWYSRRADPLRWMTRGSSIPLVPTMPTDLDGLSQPTAK